MYNYLTIDRYLDVGDAIKFRVNEELSLLLQRTSEGYTLMLGEKEIQISYKELKK